MCNFLHQQNLEKSRIYFEKLLNEIKQIKKTSSSSQVNNSSQFLINSDVGISTFLHQGKAEATSSFKFYLEELKKVYENSIIDENYYKNPPEDVKNCVKQKVKKSKEDKEKQKDKKIINKEMKKKKFSKENNQPKKNETMNSIEKKQTEEAKGKKEEQKSKEFKESKKEKEENQNIVKEEMKDLKVLKEDKSLQNPKPINNSTSQKVKISIINNVKLQENRKKEEVEENIKKITLLQK